MGFPKNLLQAFRWSTDGGSNERFAYLRNAWRNTCTDSLKVDSLKHEAMVWTLKTASCVFIAPLYLVDCKENALLEF